MTEIELEEHNDGIIITNIKWWESHVTNDKKSKKDLPDMFAVDIPNSIKELEEKNYQLYLDSIESFAYNFLTRKYGVEVSFCQINLPLKK